jgi:uncharacterized protein YdeI (YjbR/CyaY-like superfamily)
MPAKDKRVDAYIAKSADFAKPILDYLREVVHEGCPEVQETIKWRFPNFEYKGLLCNMAAFKQHCAFGFWKSSLVFDGDSNPDAMGQFGRITSLKDLPSRSVLLKYIKHAAKLNAEGVKSPARSKPRTTPRELVVPEYFLAAVKKNKKAFATFEAFPYSKKKDYVEWVSEAKSEDTRLRRMQTSVQWLSEGKARNWKYEKC